MLPRTSSIWQRDSHPTASGKPGAVHVVFLDPYGMSVRWETLRFLANTKRVDIWYLFPLHATLRQLSHDYGAIDQSKRNALLEIFGTADWDREFYKRREAPADLFGFADSINPDRIATPERVERFAAERLRTIFPFVSEPIPIRARRRLRQFSLFLLSANSNQRAINLIKKGVNAQIKKYGGSL